MNAILSAICLTLLATQSAFGQAKRPIELKPGEAQLFIDDFLIEQSKGLKRTLHQPRDVESNPVLVPEHPWEHRRIPYGSVWYDPGRKMFRCWYLAMNIYDSRPGGRGYRKKHHVPIHEAASLCYAESDDGIRWRKPMLGLHAFRGSKRNNIVLTCPGTHFDSTSVMHTPHDRERPWKMISFIGLWPYKPDLITRQWGDTRFGISQAGHYGWSSKDGIHWHPMHGGRPLLQANDRSMFWWDPTRNIYVASAKTSRDKKRAQRYAWSRDAVRWKKTSDWIHVADERDHPGDEAEAAYGFRYGSRFVGFCEIRRIRKGRPVKINWELITSRDGRHWQRPIRRMFFADGPATSWRYQVFKIFANPPIERDGELWIYYGGKTGTVSVKKGSKPYQALCLAKLRKDGFVSLDAGPQGGTLLSRPFVTTGNRLSLNVAVHKGGQVKVELRTADNTPIPGFGLKQCRAMTTGGVERNVCWNAQADLGQIAGKPVRLYVELTNADLYSLQFRKQQK